MKRIQIHDEFNLSDEDLEKVVGGLDIMPLDYNTCAFCASSCVSCDTCVSCDVCVGCVQYCAVCVGVIMQ